MLNDRKTIHAWCLYDWANSVYSLTITTAIFPIYFNAATIEAFGGDRILFLGMEVTNTVLYEYSLSLSFLITVLIIPILSGMADYAAKKKVFLKAFMLLGSFSCFGLFFFDGKNVEWGILCSVLASIGYSGSLVFYDAFLSEIVTEDKRDIVSARGYSYGYLGGVILLIFNLVVIQMPEVFGLTSNGIPARIAFLTVGLWWISFSLYAIAKLPEKTSIKNSDKHYLLNGYKEVLDVFRQLQGLKSLKSFLFAFFFYNMGVQTTMYLASLFGSKELKMEAGQLIMTILLIQFVAIGGSYLFAWLSKRSGNIVSLKVMIVIWIGCCIYAYFVYNEYQFYALAGVVGLIMGGIQALSRATYSKLMPVNTKDTASFFSFYDIVFNISIVMGTFVYGFIDQITGSMRNSTLALASFFIIGMLFLTRVKTKNVSTQTT